VKALPKWEYRVLQSTAGAVTHLNDRINSMAEEGWEAVSLSGDTMVNVLMRRPRAEKPAAETPPPPPPQEPA
jgi:hypothetical protein